LFLDVRSIPLTVWRVFDSAISSSFPQSFGSSSKPVLGEPMSKKIYVGNLSYQTTEGDLSTLFEQVGQVDSVNVITDRDTGRSKGFAFVEMSNEDADKAITQLNGTEVNGRTLTVNEARPREERSGNRGGGYGGGRPGGGGGGRGGYGGGRGGGGGGRY
jgi:cold-inducible RNA-binding protein